MIGARRDLGRMGHDQDLDHPAEPREPLADRIRRGPADTGVDLVEHEARGRVDSGEHDLESQHQPGEFAARRDPSERGQILTGVGRDLEPDPLGAGGRPFGLGQRVQPRLKTRLVKLERRQFAQHRTCEAAGGRFTGRR
jgi:hypothetical protein